MLDWYMGTMGFSWKDWVGVFYPPGTAQRDFLAYYSTVFNAVEIDSTFYGIPKPGVVKHWKDETSPGFTICCKLPKEITHDRKLVDVQGVLKSYLNSIEELDEKLGITLIQFPPSFKADQMPELEKFLAILPQDYRFALEVRHHSWYMERMEELLSQYHIAWAATEYLHLPKRIYRTADFLYLRLIGVHRRYKIHDRIQKDVTGQLEWWKDNIEEHLQNARAVYAFFNNDYSGFAAGECNHFKEILGLPTKPLLYPKQERFL